MINEKDLENIDEKYREAIRDIDLDYDLAFMPLGEGSEIKAGRAYKIAKFYRSQLDNIKTLLNPQKLFDDSCNYLANILIFNNYMNKFINEDSKTEEEKKEKIEKKKRLLKDLVEDGKQNLGQISKNCSLNIE